MAGVFTKREQERRVREASESRCVKRDERKKGKVEKDAESLGRKNKAEVMQEREADVSRRKTSEAGPLIGGE